MARFRQVLVVGAAAFALLLAGCGDDGGSDETSTSPADESESDADTGESDADTGEMEGEPEATDDEPADEGAGGGAAGGTLTIGDETITLDSARCFLEEQDAAAGGGKILFVGQGSGTNAAGDQVLLDVSRYDEDSDFTGDDVLVDIGDFETGTSLSAREELGTIQLDGQTLSADGLTFNNFDDLSELPGSFVLNC